MTVPILTVVGGLLLIFGALNLIQHLAMEEPAVALPFEATAVILIFAHGALGFAGVFSSMFWLAIINFTLCFVNLNHVV